MDALEVIGALRLEDGRRWGEAAAPWQVEDARAVLDLEGPRQHFLTRPRGASKTSDLAAVVAAVLIDQAPPASRSYGFAVSREQAGLLADALAGFVERTPEIRGALKVDSLKASNPRTGASFQIQSADDATAFGLRPFFLVCDEFAQWPRTARPQRLWRVLYSSLPKTSNSRVVILTTGGDPAHPSHKVLEVAKESEAWRVNEVPGPVPWLSDSDLAEQKRLLPSWEYERLHLNRWQAPDDRLTTVGAVRECVTLTGPQPPKRGPRYCIGLDIGLKSDATVASVCHLDGDVVVLDRQMAWQGTSANPVNLADVEEWLYGAAKQYRAEIVFDPWQGQHLAQRLRQKGLRLTEFAFSAQSVGRLALTLHRLLRDRQIALYDDPDLIDELSRVRLIETSPGSYRLDHASGEHDDRAVSLALACHRLLSTSRARRTPEERKQLAAAMGRASDELWKPSGAALA